MNVTPGQGIPETARETSEDYENIDEKTAAQVKAARSRSNSWFSQVKQREARLQAAEDKALQKEESKREAAEAKKEAKDARKSGFFGSTLRRLSSGGSKRDRRDSSSSSLYTTVSGSSNVAQNARVTLNKNTKRKRPDVAELQGTSLRRVCFQLDELVELRTYEQVEADINDKQATRNGNFPTVKDMTIIDPYASSTPLDRADLYLQCCKVYKITPIVEIEEQLRSRGPASAPYEGPRTIELRNISLSFTAAVALADCLGLPLTGKHLVQVIFDNCDLEDNTLQLLLSCLYTSANLERLDITNNSKLTVLGVRCALCFLCLSPQLRRFGWQGNQFDSGCARVLGDVLNDPRVRALTELGIANSQISESDVLRLVPLARQAGVCGLDLRGINVQTASMELLSSMCLPPNALRFLVLSDNQIASTIGLLTRAFTDQCPLISLEVANCALGTTTLQDLLVALTRLPNFRRLSLAGHDLRPLIPSLRQNLPQIRILRRLNLSNSQLESQDIVALAEVLAESKISELVLLGIPLDNAALSALYALARISKTLVNLEIDIIQDQHSEKLGRRILAECIQNMETQEANVEVIETDTLTAVQPSSMVVEKEPASIDKHKDLHDGAHGVASALDQYLDVTDEEVAKDLPLAMLERARHIRKDIEPALLEPLSELQLRRLTLVAETLDKVIKRFEETYPECKQASRKSNKASIPQTDVYEHTGRSRAAFIPSRHASNLSGVKSRELEAEEGEMMKLAHRMTDRLTLLRSASASASPSTGPSRQELADEEEAKMLERLYSADGAVLKQKLHALQQQGYRDDRALGQAIS